MPKLTFTQEELDDLKKETTPEPVLPWILVDVKYDYVVYQAETEEELLVAASAFVEESLKKGDHDFQLATFHLKSVLNVET